MEEGSIRPVEGEKANVVEVVAEWWRSKPSHAWEGRGGYHALLVRSSVFGNQKTII